MIAAPKYATLSFRTSLRFRRMRHFDGQFKGRGDLNLYYQCWLPADGPKAVLLVVHGLAEHSGRYGNLVNYFVPKGYAVYGFDHRGHGRSDGIRGHVDRFSRFVDDLDIFFEIVRHRHHDNKIFLVGHSIGGTIAASYAIVHQDKFDGLILTGAILSVPADAGPIRVLAARVLSLVLPRFGLYALDARGISRDSGVVDAYTNDPLVYRGKTRARLGVELMKAMNAVERRASEIRLPVLVMHGSADRISDPLGSEVLYQKASSADKTLRLYEGFYHELFNEPERGQVLADVESWLQARL